MLQDILCILHIVPGNCGCGFLLLMISFELQELDLMAQESFVHMVASFSFRDADLAMMF